MADADEDSLLSTRNVSADAENDISDETQDFRFLTSLSASSDSSQALPRRGEKDFEPNSTLHQADTLIVSRNAMHNAITYPRLHYPKTKLVGVFCPDGALEPEISDGDAESTSEPDIDVAERGAPTGSQSESSPRRQLYRPRSDDLCVCVPNGRGPLFRTLGQADRFNRVWLLPEEAIYLIERGSIDIRWPASPPGEPIDVQVAAIEGIPMSLQAAYAIFMARGGLSVERYTVYAGLRRMGYIVIRAESWYQNALDGSEAITPRTQGGDLVESLELGIIARLSKFFSSILDSRSSCSTSHGPVVGLGIHRNYNDIHRMLSIIPAFDAGVPDSDPKTIRSAKLADSPYRLAFNVYKPSPLFRKSVPGTPHFRVAVINARTHATIPSLAELGSLLASTPLTPPIGEKMDRSLYMRLRHGWRSVILGVVDQGVVSYLRVADAGFNNQRLYEQTNTGPASKHGSRPKKKRGAR